VDHAVALQYLGRSGAAGEVDLIVHTRPSIVLGTVFGQVNYVNYAQGVLAGFLWWLRCLLLGRTGLVHTRILDDAPITGAVTTCMRARSA